MMDEKTWNEIQAAFAAGATTFDNGTVFAVNTAAGLEPPRERRDDEPMPRFEIRRARAQRPSVEDARAFVGGRLVELLLVRLPQGNGQHAEGHLLINEEGRLLDLPRNPLASALYGHPVVGPAMLLLGDARWE